MGQVRLNSQNTPTSLIAPPRLKGHIMHTLFPYKDDGQWVVASWNDDETQFNIKAYKCLLRALWEYQKRVKQK